jgi:hypothetical protein
LLSEFLTFNVLSKSFWKSIIPGIIESIDST